VDKETYEKFGKLPIPALLIIEDVEKKGKRETDIKKTEFRLLLLEKYSCRLL
jgi:hypothetical protein